MATERLVSPKPHVDDQSIDTSLRPRSLPEYIGQQGVKDNLDIAIKAARQRGEPLDHILFYGPPGLGKTTLANILATEMGVRIKTTSGPAIERPGDMVAVLTQLQKDDILFVDEVHRLSRVVEEVLYPAMEDFFVSWVIDKGLKARSMNLSVKPFTMVGATTRYGMVSSPLRDRFGTVHRLEFYDEESMRIIVERSARILEIEAEPDGIAELARRRQRDPQDRKPVIEARPRLRPSEGRQRSHDEGDGRGAGQAGGKTIWAWTKSTTRCSGRLSRNSPAGPWAWIRSPHPSARTRTPSRMSASPSCSNWAF